MQPNAQQVHDDLAALFSRTLTFNPELRASALKDAPRMEAPSALCALPSAPAAQPIIYSISQHYHHSAHAARPPPRPSSEPPQADPNAASEALLRSHGIDAAVLTPSQLQLFRIADEPQRLRLVELWSICPPHRGDDIPALAWSSTTLAHEEHLARQRLDRQQHNQIMSLDGTPIQAADGRWAAPTAPAGDAAGEPYMLSGYEELMRREAERSAASCHWHAAAAASGCTPATDPVYLGPDFARQQQQQQQQMQMQMAMQYGAVEHFRAAPELDAMDVM